MRVPSILLRYRIFYIFTAIVVHYRGFNSILSKSTQFSNWMGCKNSGTDQSGNRLSTW